MARLYLKCRDWREAETLNRELLERDASWAGLCVLRTGNLPTKTVEITFSPSIGAVTVLFNTRVPPGGRAISKSEALSILREAAQ